MTTAELIRLLKNHGCYFLDEGTRHDRMRSPITGKTFLIGRHKSQEVATGTLHKILKAAGIKLH